MKEILDMEPGPYWEDQHKMDFESLPTLEEATKMEQEHFEKTGEHINVIHK